MFLFFKLETLNDLLSNRRLPGEIKRLHRPVIEIANFNISSNDMNMSEEFGLNDVIYLDLFIRNMKLFIKY